MAQNRWWAKVLRVLGIILMGITAAFTIMSGAGTTCVALAAEKFGPNMAPLAPYQWLYIIFVLVTTAIGVMGVRATVLLVKGRSNAYRYAIIALILGILVGVIHMVVSRSLRGKSMPVDAVVYITVLTLIVFLIFRIPAIWRGVNFDKTSRDHTGAVAGGMAMMLGSIAVLTVPLWAAATHTFTPGGTNWADAWHWQLNLLGALFILGGLLFTISPILKKMWGEGVLRQAVLGEEAAAKNV